MTQLTTTTSKALAPISQESEKALQLLPADDRKIIAAGLAPAVRKLDPVDCQAEFAGMIGIIYTLAGQKTDVHTITVHSSAFYERLMEEFPMATLEEVRTALTNGVYDKYGDYMGINAKSMMHFVRSYMKSQERKGAMEDYEKLKKLKAPAELGPPYWEADYWTEGNVATWKIEAEKHYEYFIHGNILYRAMPEGVYWALCHMGLIIMTEDYETRLMKEAKINYHIELLNSTRPDKPRLLQELEAFVSENLVTRLHLEAKRLAVIRHFLYLNEQHKKLVEKLTAANNKVVPENLIKWEMKLK